MDDVLQAVNGGDLGLSGLQRTMRDDSLVVRTLADRDKEWKFGNGKVYTYTQSL